MVQASNPEILGVSYYTWLLNGFTHTVYYLTTSLSVSHFIVRSIIVTPTPFSCTWYCSTFLLICVQHVLEHCFHLYSLIYYPFISVLSQPWVPLGFLTEIWSLAIRLGWLAGEPLGFACLHLPLARSQVCTTTSGFLHDAGDWNQVLKFHSDRFPRLQLEDI